MGQQITDPADRLGWAGDGSGEEFVKALEKRYDNDPPIHMIQIPEFAERFSNVCDLMVQLLWPEHYAAGAGDPWKHTSAPAREMARLIFIAAGIDGAIPQG